MRARALDLTKLLYTVSFFIKKSAHDDKIKYDYHYYQSNFVLTHQNVITFTNVHRSENSEHPKLATHFPSFIFMKTVSVRLFVPDVKKYTHSHLFENIEGSKDIPSKPLNPALEDCT